MAIRSLRYNDDAILRKRCRPVDEVTDRIRELLNDMAETMYAENGAGLAACQVGILKRLVTIDMGDGLLKLVNPEIVEVYGEQACVEACLSFPGRVGQTVRPQCVTIRARNEKGEEVLYTGKGDLAKCFCHELDHLVGLFCRTASQHGYQAGKLDLIRIATGGCQIISDDWWTDTASCAILMSGNQSEGSRVYDFSRETLPTAAGAQFVAGGVSLCTRRFAPGSAEVGIRSRQPGYQ